MSHLHPPVINPNPPPNSLAFLPSPFPKPLTRKSRTRKSLTPIPSACITRPASTRPPPITQTFNWTDQWYPVALTTDLNPLKPNPLTLLSTPLVAFRSAETWVVLHDRCPHRHASLSHGRITQNRLECRYHGWQFSSDGTAEYIPQSPGCAAQSATTVRTKEIHNILFCSLGNPTHAPPVVQFSKKRFVVSQFSRVLPLCFTTVMQNLLDPAHIHFAHHGSIGRREHAAPVEIRILDSVSKAGFVADYYNGSVRLRFRPPCLVEIVTVSGVSFAYYTTPLSQSSSKAFAIRSTGYRQFFVPPRWMDHLRRHKLLEDDLALMQGQQGYMTREKGYHKGWKEFCMPATADRLIVEMRKWLETFAPEESWYGCDVATDHGRWGHTVVCPACWNVWWRLGILKKGFEVLGLGVLLAAAARASRVLAVFAGVLAVSVRVLQWARRKFE